MMGLRWETVQEKEREIGRRLGSPPTPAEWQPLMDAGYSPYTAWDEREMTEAVELVKMMRQENASAWGRLTGPVRRPDWLPPDLLEVWQAAFGGGPSLVEAIREDALGQRQPVLAQDAPLEEYAALLRRLAETPGPPDAPARVAWAVSLSVVAALPLEPSGFLVGGVEAPPGSMLAYLMRCCRWLGLATGLPPVAILVCILTGATLGPFPWAIEVPAGRFVFTPKGAGGRYPRLGAGKKATKEALLRQFLSARQRVPWPELLAEWNRSYGHVATYRTVAALRRAAHRAGVRRRA